MMEETLQGGYRLLGQSAVKNPGLPVISIITVVYNSLSLIEKTIRNILDQSYPNIEFLVIDGGSSDGTAEIIRFYEKQISYWISEPDRGIYDAMNKGLAAATGDYVWFMNAGDQIYRSDILETIFVVGPDTGSWEENLVFYGDTMIVNTGFHEIGLRRLRPPEVLSWKSFKKGMLVCHQAIIVSRKIAEPFDPQYGHSADFDWVVRALRKAQGYKHKAQGSRLKAQVRIEEQGTQVERSSLPTNQHIIQSTFQTITTSSNQHISTSSNQHIVNTHLVLCAFLDGGHSKKNIGISLRERFHSMVRHYGLIPTILRHIPIAIRFGWYFLRNKRF